MYMNQIIKNKFLLIFPTHYKFCIIMIEIEILRNLIILMYKILDINIDKCMHKYKFVIMMFVSKFM